MRSNFDRQLENLNNELIIMGSMCEEVIAASVQAALGYTDAGNGSAADSAELCRRVFRVDAEIDRKEREIENLCMSLLLRQQPVARDLRIVSSALKMISDMERIGDQASDIAELSKHIKESQLEHRLHLLQMARETIKMVTDSVESFVKKDIDGARAVIAYDDVVDGLFDEVKKELIGLVSSDGKNAELYMDLFMVAKYFERIGDHATNIAQWVEYSITGVHPDIDTFYTDLT